jgi:hypothetical protein
MLHFAAGRQVGLASYDRLIPYHQFQSRRTLLTVRGIEKLLASVGAFFQDT